MNLFTSTEPTRVIAMPLLDHFHPPLSESRNWEGFHSAWANAIVMQLNQQLLPPRYFAEALIRWGRSVEIDVATFEAGEDVTAARDDAETATAWSPPRATLTVPVDFAPQDVVEVRVISEEAGPTLVAAIELISPGNKDRPSHREAFTTKCAAYLQQGVAVVIVDVVTQRIANLHLQLLDQLHISSTTTAVSHLYAVAYRTVSGGEQFLLDIWPESLHVGQPLPTLPLWLDGDLAVPLNLDESYLAAQRALRIDSD